VSAGRSELDLWVSPRRVRCAYATCRYGQLHYRSADCGSPKHPPFLIFHQTPTSSRCYEGLLVEMARDRLAIAVDTPGFGASDPPAKAPTINDYALAMLDLLDALEFDTIDILGDHTGAKIAVELALICPDRVRRVVLNGAPVYSDAELAALQRQDRDVETIAPDGAHILARWRWAMAQRAPSTPLDAVLLEVAESLQAGANVWHGHYAAFSYQHRELLPKVRQPVLVLRAHDDLWEPTGRAKSLIRNGRMIDLPDWGREMLLIRSAQVAPILRDFLGPV